MFGAVTPTLNAGEVDFVRTLGIISQFRGIDSTGIAVVTKPKRKGAEFMCNVFKQQMDPSYFFMQDAANAVLSTKNSCAIIGHCRAATVGNVTPENAHPYDIGNIVGAHNGTIHALSTYGNSTTAPTDSFRLYEIIAKDGLEAGLERARDGAFALTYYDKTNDTINLIRNDKRELWLAKGPGIYYWASERIFLEFVATRRNVKLEDIQLIPEMTLFQFQAGTLAVTTRKIELPEPAWKHGNLAERRAAIMQRKFGQGVPVSKDGEEVKQLSFMKPGCETEVPPHPPRVTSGTAGTGAAPFILGPKNTGNTVLNEDAVPLSAPYVTRPGCNEKTLDSAKAFYPTRFSAKLIYPLDVMVKIGKATILKKLKFIGPRQEVISLKETFELLERGCAVSGTIADIGDTVYWINDKDYVLPDFRANEMVVEMCKAMDTKPLSGYACYVSPSHFKTLQMKYSKSRLRYKFN